MKLCENCFLDIEIKGIIQEKKTKGNCDICKDISVAIYDTDVDNYLVDYFEGLFEIYELGENLVDDFPPQLKGYLKEDLKLKWNIFSEELNYDDIQNIIQSICKEYFDENPKYLTDLVGIPELFDKEYLDDKSIVGRFDWLEFVRSIKEDYRFHTNFFVKDVMEIYCTYLTKTLRKDDIFYRARISDENGYTTDMMGAPPKHLAKAGRINPEGMNYLYLGNQVETTLYESRATIYDYVSVGRFKLKEDIKVVDLTDTESISVFFPELDFKLHAINREHLKMLNEEVASPLRRNDSKLDYLPTQYICDFIKSIKDEISDLAVYSGIKYKSTLYENGYNVAIFDQSIFECTDVKVYEIKELQYSF